MKSKILPVTQTGYEEKGIEAIKEKIKLLLVKPPQKTNEVQPPLGLGYIASAIEDIANTTIIDSIKEGYSIKETIESISKKDFDIIGFQCYTVDIRTIKKISSVIKRRFPDKLHLIGGPQPSLDPVGTLKYLPSIDYGFVSEAEISMKIFLQHFKNKTLKKKNLKKIPGLIYRLSNKIIFNQPKRPENLDDFNPSWHLYGMKTYPLAPHGAFFKQQPTAPLILSRGCPFQCTYCGGPRISGFKIRRHSVDYAIDMIKMLHYKYGIKEIHIEDDNFTMDRKYVEEFCNKLIKLNLGISWQCPNGMRLDTLDDNLIKLMKKSGLYSASVGIESGSDRIRKLMKKNLLTETIKKKVRLLRKHGLGIIGFFIVGYPGETKKEMDQTIRLAQDLDLKRATFSIFKPFPGTPAYNELVSQGKINKLNWENFSLDKVAWAPEGISEKELKDIRRKAFLKFYLRPKIILNMALEIKTFENFLFIVRRMFRWLT